MIRVVLPQNRRLPGELTATFDGVTHGPFRCLGKADNGKARSSGNPTRDPLKVNGDTPTGSYIATIGEVYGGKTYGPHPVIRLEPVSGDALKAKQNGRKGLLNHSGTTRDGQLRPTFGCIRDDDDTQEKLVNLIQAHGGQCDYVIEERKD